MGASRRPAGAVDRTPRQWHCATTGHAMTVAVGDGRGFSSLAAAPDGRAPAQCTARSWPGYLPAVEPLAPKPLEAPEYSSISASRNEKLTGRRGDTRPRKMDSDIRPPRQATKVRRRESGNENRAGNKNRPANRSARQPMCPCDALGLDVRTGPSPGPPRRSTASRASSAPASGKSSSWITPFAQVLRPQHAARTGSRQRTFA